LPTTIDYYKVLRPHRATSDAAIPTRLVSQVRPVRSQVPVMCLSLDVGATFTPVEFAQLYLCTVRLGVLPIPCYTA